MTLGQKIKDARSKALLTQEELAEKLIVSRQAVSKWESDKGMPDISNIKALSKLLNVSVDYLISNDTTLDMNITREPIDLGSHSGRKAKVKDSIVRTKFPQAQINELYADPVLTKAEKRVDNMVLLISPLTNVVKLSKQLNNTDKAYYLVTDSEQQYLVCVTDEFIETRRLASKITERKFTLGEYIFKRTARKIK